MSNSALLWHTRKTEICVCLWYLLLSPFQCEIIIQSLTSIADTSNLVAFDDVIAAHVNVLIKGLRQV